MDKHRQAYREFAASARTVAARLDPTAVHLRQPLCQGQANAESAE